LDTAALVGRGACALVDVQGIALGVVHESAVVPGVVDAASLLYAADEAVRLGGCSERN
jgi:hypothetical protein